MTLTMTIIKIMADGQPRSLDELAEITGRTRPEVVAAMGAIRRQNWAKGQPAVVRYVLTPAGMERSKWTSRTDPDRLARKAARYAKARQDKREALKRAREIERERALEDFSQDADGIVEQAMRKQHPLASAWGGVNA